MRAVQSNSGELFPVLIAAGAAVVGIPFYLGLVHMPLTEMLLYSSVASTAMATANYVDTPKDERSEAHGFLVELGLWFAVIVLFGGMAYFTGLIF